MLRTLLGLVILLALPTLLVAQAPATRQSGSANSAIAHGVAMDVQGEVVEADEIDDHNNQQGVEESDGNNNQEGVDEADGPDENGISEVEGPDHDDVAGEDQGSTAEQNTQFGRHQP